MRTTRMIAGVVATPASLARWQLIATVLLVAALCAGCEGSDSSGDALSPKNV